MIPAFLLRHTVVVEPYLGAGATGPIFGPPVTVKCFIDNEERLIRTPDTDTRVSPTTCYCRLDTVAPPHSRVTGNGWTATVLEAKRRDGGGLPTPDHLELVLV